MTATATAATRLGHRAALDGVRAGAVLAVMLDHTGVLPWGFAGVDVFFALSGFLITTLLCEEHDRTGRIALRAFYARRARRLLPALLLVLIAYTVLVTRFGLFGSYWPLGQRIGSTLLYANNWVLAAGHSPFGPLTPTWSLAQEEQFYLAWPILLVLLRRARIRPLGMVALLVGAVVALMYLLPHWGFGAGLVSYYNPIDRFGELLVGAATAVVHRRFPAVIARLTRPGAVGLVAAAVIGGLAAVGDSLPLRPRLVVTVLAAAVLVLHAVHGTGLLVRLLASPPARYLGRISYGLYLFHLPLLYLLLIAEPHLGSPAQTAILLPLAVLAATLSWQLVERRFTDRAPSRPADEVTTPHALAREAQ